MDSLHPWFYHDELVFSAEPCPLALAPVPSLCICSEMSYSISVSYFLVSLSLYFIRYTLFHLSNAYTYLHILTQNQHLFLISLHKFLCSLVVDHSAVAVTTADSGEWFLSRSVRVLVRTLLPSGSFCMIWHSGPACLVGSLSALDFCVLLPLALLFLSHQSLFRIEHNHSLKNFYFSVFHNLTFFGGYKYHLHSGDFQIQKFCWLSSLGCYGGISDSI